MDGFTGAVDDGDDESFDDDAQDDGCAGFYGGCPDGGGVNIECDVWAQDCPIGEKCMPWANDGGFEWNATRCTEIASRPDAVGDACTVEGSGVSGFDSCEAGAMCWDVDPTNEGTCVEFCSGSGDSPLCSDPSTRCTVMNEGVLILCLPVCDPLMQDCVAGQGCYPFTDGFVCLPDGSGRSGAFGDPCIESDACDPGLFCAPTEAVPECVDASGCCSELCDVGVDEPDLQCTGQPQGQSCVPWFADGEAPPGLEDVGSCLIPGGP
jgi:hypothetical protein